MRVIFYINYGSTDGTNICYINVISTSHRIVTTNSGHKLGTKSYSKLLDLKIRVGDSSGQKPGRVEKPGYFFFGLTVSFLTYVIFRPRESN